ncbi:hypothetical protein DRP04_12465, partial [Archaeoglobales archaeon]
VVGFDYTNAEEWRSFVKNQILPLHKSISKIVKLRESLEELLSNDLSDLIRNNINIKRMLLGGVDENGDHKPNSLAKMYREFLGVSINTKEWVSLSKQPGIDAAEYIKCSFTDTPLLQFVKDIKEIVYGLLSLAEVDREEVKDDEIKDLLENPEKIVNELREIYTRLVGISANHSYYTFFTINTRCIPRYYIEQAYPKLKDKFEEVAEFLGLEPKFVPHIKEEKIKRNYTLWGHKEKGFADLLYRLNRAVWNFWNKAKNIIEAIAKVKDLKEEYYERVEKMLIKIQWEFPTYLHIYKFPENYRYFITSEGMITHYIEGSSRCGSGGKLEKPISWFQLLDVLSPAMFLHKVEMKIREDLFGYEESIVGEGKKKLYIVACDSEYYGLW